MLVDWSLAEDLGGWPDITGLLSGNADTGW